MIRSITYVVLAAIIWSAQTQDEENVRNDMFKSNMTRNDFSKLLSSLIKLNEKRVSVLQKLYRLEDYGVLSEVLRSGDRKTENGNPSNLFLIVMSKGAIDAKTIINNYQVLQHDGKKAPAEDVQPTKNSDEVFSDLLGLMTLKNNEKLSRRSNEDRFTSSIEGVSENVDDTIEELIRNAHDNILKDYDDDKPQKKNEKAKEKQKKAKTKQEKGKTKQENAKTKQEQEKTKEKKKAERRKALRQLEERAKVKKELRRRCVTEIDNKVVKCIKACRRTEQDVCSRLACSVRSRKELIKECDNSCKDTFVPEDC